VTDTASTQSELWGGETRKAIANFPVSGEPIPTPVARWLGRIKAAAARVNGELGLLDEEKAQRIAAAADRVAGGELDAQFPIDVFQTGSGTSSNMNANEVIANVAGEGIHPNDDVNMGQSSNDVFPSAVHLAALDEITHDLLPALDRLASTLEHKADEFADVVKSGRTHWMDAVPVTLGQEFGGYAAQVRQGIARVQDTLPFRYRGMLEVDLEICTACLACERACPIDCIVIEAEKDKAAGGLVMTRFDIDMAKCMYCGLCSEPCPTGAIHHTPEFEGADYSLESMVRRFVKAPVVAYKPKKGGETDPEIAPILERGMRYVEEFASPDAPAEVP